MHIIHKLMDYLRVDSCDRMSVRGATAPYYIYIYIYMYVYIYVCVYVYIYMCVCVCVCLRI